MLVANLSKRQSFLALGFFSVFFWMMLFTHGAHAASGFASTSFPDQTNSSKTTWTLNELCSADTTKCMKGAANYIAVYVPIALLDTTVTIKITDGCDTTAADQPGGKDTFGYTASTFFGVYDTNYVQHGTALSSDDPGCPGSTDLSYDFIASGPTLTDGNGKYLIYMFAGLAIRAGLPDGWSWYVNHYRLDSQSPGVLVGTLNQALAPNGLACNNKNAASAPLYWPLSCPTNPYDPSQNGLSFSTIDGWDGGGGEWNETIAFASTCSSGSTVTGHVVIYDPDHGIYQNDMRITLEEIDRNTHAHLSWLIPPPGLLVDGGNDDSWFFPGGNNSPGAPFTLVNTSAYIATVSNIADVNSLQILMAGASPSASYTCETPTCSALSVYSITNGTPTIHPGDQIGFTVNVKDANGYRLGVNGPGPWGDEYPDPRTGGPTTDITNQLVVTPGTYARGSPTIAADGTLTVNAVSYTDGSPLVNPVAMNAPFGVGSYPFNWGFVMPGVGWANVTCAGTINVTEPPPSLTCGTVTPSSADLGEFLSTIEVSFTTNAGGPLRGGVISVSPINGAAVAPFPITPDPYPASTAYTSSASMKALMPSTPQDVPVTWVISGTNLSPSLTCNGFIRVQARPYFKVYGGDVRSGSGFAPAAAGVCSNSGITSSIKAWGNLGIHTGASTEYGVISEGAIDQFGSAGLRGIAPLPPNGLTFANDNVADLWGGNFGTNVNSCIPNYWEKLKNNPSGPNAGFPVLLNGSGQELYKGGGAGRCGTVSNKSSDDCFNLSGVLSSPNRLTVFVDGDLNIRGNGNAVSYGGAPWASVVDIPYLTVVVCGNIYINSSVTEISGWYIAMPRTYCAGSQGRPAPGGVIYTCTNDFALYDSATLYDACKTSLLVRGSFSAQNIKFLRTFGSISLSDAYNLETSAFAPNNIAEKFIYDPSSWLAKPAQKPANTNTADTKIDAITGLPPVL